MKEFDLNPLIFLKINTSKDIELFIENYYEKEKNKIKKKKSFLIKVVYLYDSIKIPPIIPAAAAPIPK